jgi:hypothetical protein
MYRFEKDLYENDVLLGEYTDKERKAMKGKDMPKCSWNCPA